MIRFLMPLFLCFSATAFGALFQPDLDKNFDELYVMVMDNPTHLKKWAAEQLNDPKQTLSPLQKSRLVATYAGSCFEIRCAETDPVNNAKVIGEALQVARLEQDAALHIRLEIYLLRLRLDTLDNKAAEAEYERIRAAAELRGSGRLQGEVYREMSALVERDNDLPKALTRIQLAMSLSQKDSFVGDLIPIVIQHDAALHFRRVGDTSRAMDLYDYALKFMREKKIHHLAAISPGKQGPIQDGQLGYERVGRGRRLAERRSTHADGNG